MRFLDDLIAIGAATIVLLATILLLPESPVRVVLGLPFVLFFPGYTLIAALYPRKTDLDGIERLALSLGLSLAVVPLIGLVLNYTPWGIRLGPIVTSLTMFIMVSSFAAGIKRARLSESERFPADIRPVSTSIRQWPWRTLIASAAVIGLLLLAGFRFGILGGTKVGEPFTEFYVLGPSGKAEGYPRALLPGQDADVILGVVNHEGRELSYSIQVRAEGRSLKTAGPIQLQDEQKWEEKVSFALSRPNEKVKVEFLLLIPGASSPYRSLHLWVRVRPLR